MTKSHYLGIEIGGTKLQVVVGDAEGRIHDRHRFVVDRDRGAEGIREQIKSVVPGLAGTIDAVGIGFGGPTNWRTGDIVLSHHVPGWSEFPLGSWVSELAGGKPTFVDNDANVAGLAEAVCGAGKGHGSLFYVTLGSGVGGGLIQAGEIFHGGGSTETEIGHLRLDRAGSIVESRCSGWSVDQRIRGLITENPDTPLANMVAASDSAPATHLLPALQAGDPLASSLIMEVGADLGFALAQVTQLMSPNLIVIGGGLSLIGDPLMSAIQEGLNRDVMEALRPAPTVCAAALGEDTVPVGALLLAAQGSRSTPQLK